MTGRASENTRGPIGDSHCSDTPTDMRFARNGGIAAVGLARSEGARRLLSPLADTIISDLSALRGALSRLRKGAE